MIRNIVTYLITDYELNSIKNNSIFMIIWIITTMLAITAIGVGGVLTIAGRFGSYSPSVLAGMCLPLAVYLLAIDIATISMLRYIIGIIDRIKRDSKPENTSA